MIEIITLEVGGIMPAMHGMRNPKNSWSRQDSYYPVHIGENDHDLAMRLASGGPVHAKYRRMMTVYADITAPLYWWKEFDTYRVGVEKNSCSTMHKIHAKEFRPEDFSLEHVISHKHSEADNFSGCVPMDVIDGTIRMLNTCRDKYLSAVDSKDSARAKMFWWQLIQLLPSSYNQRRTVMMSYEALANMCRWRQDHKLDEWRQFVKWAKTLPHSELFCTANGQEAAKPKTGHWIFESAYCEAWSHTCSECGKRMTTAYNTYANYCWNCGTKMECS